MFVFCSIYVAIDMWFRSLLSPVERAPGHLHPLDRTRPELSTP